MREPDCNRATRSKAALNAVELLPGVLALLVGGGWAFLAATQVQSWTPWELNSIDWNAVEPRWAAYPIRWVMFPPLMREWVGPVLLLAAGAICLLARRRSKALIRGFWALAALGLAMAGIELGSIAYVAANSPVQLVWLHPPSVPGSGPGLIFPMAAVIDAFPLGSMWLLAAALVLSQWIILGQLFRRSRSGGTDHGTA